MNYKELIENLDRLQHSDKQERLEEIADRLAADCSSSDLISAMLGSLHVINSEAQMIVQWIGKKNSTPKKWGEAIQFYRLRAHVAGMALSRKLKMP